MPSTQSIALSDQVLRTVTRLNEIEREQSALVVDRGGGRWGRFGIRTHKDPIALKFQALAEEEAQLLGALPRGRFWNACGAIARLTWLRWQYEESNFATLTSYAHNKIPITARGFPGSVEEYIASGWAAGRGETAERLRGGKNYDELSEQEQKELFWHFRSAVLHNTRRIQFEREMEKILGRPPGLDLDYWSVDCAEIGPDTKASEIPIDTADLIDAL